MSDDSTVYIVDDDDAVRKGLTRLITSAGYQVHAFNSARAFLERARESTWPACLLLDVQMPDLNGLDVQRELNAAESVMPIIFITGHGDIPMSVRAMKAGAADFIAKPPRDTELLDAISRAMERAARDGASKGEIDSIRKRIATLTRREHEVMQLVVAGRLNKQIAADLGTVEKTVKVHRARVMRKMEVTTLADLVRCVSKAVPDVRKPD
jgi:FixJ family two-component response regulator